MPKAMTMLGREAQGKKLAQQNLTMVYIAKLLQAERAALRRVVVKYKESCRPPNNDRCVEAWEAWHYIEKTCDDLMVALERGKK